MLKLIKWIAPKFWLLCFITGFLGFLHIFLWMPHTSEIDSLWQVSYKIFVYCIICAGISFFPSGFRIKLINVILLISVFFIFLGLILPRIGYMGFHALPAHGEMVFGEFYTMLFLILYPFICLSLGFAFRLGGGSPGGVFKITVGGQIILFSGFLDLIWHIVNQVPYPQIFYNAHHVKVVIGHFPNLLELIIFVIVHLLLLVVFVLLPIDKWLSGLRDRIAGG